MILEIAQLTIRPGQTGAFEQAFAQAQRIIASMQGYQSDGVLLINFGSNDDL
ncbi:antibiotic biosynthesis monooxygenase family protein [Acidovorax sp.]|uniref:antibiotic biosynthesis monooxygenase family protein n=1 Tax=Acidovorax sp. TaxID=1872122 RepID=UPI003A1030F6